MAKNGLAIIFHSGSYDRIYHGLSIGLAALALGQDVRFFFSYWSLDTLRQKEPAIFKLDKEGEAHRELLQKKVKAGHMLKITELFTQAKSMGAKFYVCTSSMALLNIARDELIKAVDKSMGITTFLTEIADYQTLFI